MAKKHRPYAPEFRRQMIELVRAGRGPEELAKEFEPSAQAIRNWVAQADRDEGRRADGLTTAEREELNRLRRENPPAQVGARDPLKSRGLVRSGDGCDPAEGFQFVSENRARYPIAVMCRILGVSPSGYYAWVKRPASARALMDAALTAEIRAAHAASKGTYGAPRLQIDLAEAGIRVGRKRVARLMLNAGLVGVSRRKSAVTTVRDGAARRPISSTAISPRISPIGCGWPISRIFQRGAASSIWRLCSMRSAAGSSAGRWRPPCTCRWCSTPSTWRSGSGGRAA